MQTVRKAAGWFSSGTVIAAVIILTVFGSIVFADKGFFTPNALMNVARRAASEGGVAALGLTCVLLTGNMDLSVGAVAALAGVTAGIMQPEGAVVAILAALCLGAICGFINGVLVTRLRLPSWLATLGMMCMARNAAQLVCSQRTISVTSATWQRLGSTHLFGVHIQVILFGVLTLLCMYLLKYSGMGKRTLAVGSSREAAAASGIRTDRVIISAFTCCSLLSALAGVMLAGRLYTASYNAGSGWEITVTAMCVLGGVRLTGGKGRFSGVFFGALLVSLISTLCNYTGVLGVEWQNIIICLLMLGAIVRQEGFPGKGPFGRGADR